MYFRLLMLTCLIHNNVAFNSHSNENNRTKRWVGLNEVIPQSLDVGVFVPDEIVKHGYIGESHRVTTSDNYILTLHRIPFGKYNSNIRNRPVVLLMHGFLGSSADWVIMGPRQGLAYLLADLGYDVWMGNARGNLYSRQHLFLNPNQSALYWDFSWHEIGIYDLPKIVDFIIETTGQRKLHYIGHSQGCTVFFVLCSLFPEYNEKFYSSIALAPAVYMKHLRSPVMQALVEFREPAEIFLRSLGEHEFLPSSSFKNTLSHLLCNSQAITQDICSNILFLICGFNKEQLNKTMLPVILATTPAGGSTKQLLHFSQGVISNKFQQYDYEVEGNMRIYGTPEPPEYNLQNVKVPVALMYGQNDFLVGPEDVERLATVLPNVVFCYKVPYKHFAHLDFVFAIDVVSLVYSKIFKLLLMYH